ncbi:FAD-dependent oxidoreductase [Pararhizobium mangrovi]|uniref:GMC family oxidoreductase n=1 Tax=Pararhizobium mangrovi TaxID=2590452 RepID=A0A506UH29_9HYPH|nr:GMC family oxidoreductase [Pararhizobium mangrovi]TPW32077.1 GMC family oxidoreductase [Pararhizobium mangrovi]
MIENNDAIAGDESVAADLCIVGAGPAGIALARELVGSRMKVVLVESGNLEIEPLSQKLNEAVVSGLPFTGHAEGRGRAFGGSARLWAGQCLPLDPIDLEERPWVRHSGWPIAYGELEPYWRRAERFFGVEGESYGARTYRPFGLAAPAWDPRVVEAMFTVYTPSVDTGRAHIRAFRNATNLRVLVNATVSEIRTDATGRKVEGVTVSNASGAERTILARRVVLCGGALENARLLLLSRSANPKGLGNTHDLVGRFFQDHPNGLTAVLEGDGADLQERFRLLYARSRRYFPKLKLSEALQREARVLNANAHLVFDYPPGGGLDTLRTVVHALRRRDLGAETRRQVLRLPRHAGEIVGAAIQHRRGRSPIAEPTSVHLQCYLEQEPDPESRVTLSTQRSDAHGSPMLDINWTFGELEQRTLKTVTEAICGEFERLRLGRLKPLPWLEGPREGYASHLRDGYHHAGTTRMARSPEEGVVDADCAVFDVDGLYACGGSVFPTSGYANPTLTIVALAIRLADHLGERFRQSGMEGGTAARDRRTATLEQVER